MNAITYKEVFPLIQHNKAWLGNGFSHGNAYFSIPKDVETEYASGVYDSKTKLVKFRNCCWFTDIDHGRRHQPLSLMTMADNLKYSKHREIRERGYPKYDNYDAIEVSYTDAIPSDYKAGMGVPISFLDKYCPEQFEIEKFRKGNDEKDLTYTIEECENSLDETRRDETRRDETRRDETRRDERSEQLRHTSGSSSGARCNGVMGVPISFLDKLCPEQFEILGIANSARWIGDFPCLTLISGRKVYNRILIRFKR